MRYSQASVPRSHCRIRPAPSAPAISQTILYKPTHRCAESSFRERTRSTSHFRLPISYSIAAVLRTNSIYCYAYIPRRVTFHTHARVRSTFAPSSHRLPRFRHPIKAIDSWPLGGSCRCAMTHICSSSPIGIHRTDRAKRDQYPRQCNRDNYEKENLHTAILHTLSSANYASITTTAGLGEQASSIPITFHGCEHNAPG
jgi:hypothetical protein